MREFKEKKDHITSFKKFVEIVEERHSATTDNPYAWILEVMTFPLIY